MIEISSCEEIFLGSKKHCKNEINFMALTNTLFIKSIIVRNVNISLI